MRSLIAASACVLLVSASSPTSVYPLIRSDTFVRTAKVHTASEGTTFVDLVNKERDVPTGPWYESTYSYSSSFPIRSLSRRTADDFFVAGETKSGIDIIERWQVQRETGAYVAIKAAYKGPSGQPYLSPGLVLQVYKIAFIPPSQRQQPAMTRTEVFSGDLGGITVMAADPDGRFVLVVSENKLKKLPLDGGPVEVLYDAQTIPELNSARPNLMVMDHGTLGRTYTLIGRVTGMTTERVLFVDNDNNGAFESHTAYSPATYDTSGIPGGWTDDFLNY